ncbi:MAG: beta-propeller domain-containing protein [Verrucomicrobiota bacterium]
MRYLKFILPAVLTSSLLLLASGLANAAQNAPAPKPSSLTPCLDVLSKFTAPGVPALGPGESPVPALTNNQASSTGLPGNGLAQHSMLYVGEGRNVIYLVHQGKVIWTYSTGRGGEYDDVWMLSNGNILFTRMQYIAEVTPKKEVVWRYDAPTNTEIHACQPIGLDKVLFIQNGLPPKLMVVNIKTKAVEVEHALPAPSTNNQKTVHGQFRRVRYTAQGTYLVPFLGFGQGPDGMGRVVEYDKNFNEIWRYEIQTPWAAIRLKNGNTLISDEKLKLTREVNPKGETVWELKLEDLPESCGLRRSQSCTRLANGNTILCARNGNAQLVEVTPDKKVVWALNDPRLGPATAVQILDDPGIPENPGESEH